MAGGAMAEGSVWPNRRGPSWSSHLLMCDAKETGSLSALSTILALLSYLKTDLSASHLVLPLITRVQNSVAACIEAPERSA
eukprot:5411712-Pyramimonas_sp.AAC.1